jgi:uncharacterized protein (TIGR03435 family)
MIPMISTISRPAPSSRCLKRHTTFFEIPAAAKTVSRRELCGPSDSVDSSAKLSGSVQQGRIQRKREIAMRRYVLGLRLGLAAAFLAAVATGQSKVPGNKRFDVVSIKPSAPGKYCGYHPSPLQLRLDDCSIEKLIKNAYGLTRDYQSAGMPKWAASAAFTIVGKTSDPANPGEQWDMTRRVLEDRFNLKYHHENRQMGVYFLSVIREVGLKLRETAPATCVPIDPKVGPVPPFPVNKGDPMPPRQCGYLMRQVLPESGIELEAVGMTMAQLAGALGISLDRPVLDQTGTSKLFDVELSFAKSDIGAEDASSDPSGLPIIPAALKKVGLKLTRGQGPLNVFVIDHVEQPSVD